MAVTTVTASETPVVDREKLKALFPPLDPSLFSLTEEESTFYKAATGIEDDEQLKDHIMKVQQVAYDVFGYQCIRNFSFLKLKISRLPDYQRVLKISQERPDAILLDIGCCFGNDLRKAVADGWPVENAIASDLYQEFWDAGHQLFRTTPETFPAKFIQGDIFNVSHIAPRDPFYAPPTTPRPSLPSLTSLIPLQGHISAIHASAFIHLFNEEQQLQICKLLATLLSPEPGSVIFGCHGGLPKKGLRQQIFKNIDYRMFCHDPESFKELWETQVFEKGTVKVETQLVERVRTDTEVNVGTMFYVLVWTVTRL
ncbi:hypothetical protein ONZ45_g4716 [Pleurotus djamor]|nr:hypothetical protein ONZ45_g4716 [Pleurotus djamor]